MAISSVPSALVSSARAAPFRLSESIIIVATVDSVTGISLYAIELMAMLPDISLVSNVNVPVSSPFMTML